MQDFSHARLLYSLFFSRRFERKKRFDNVAEPFFLAIKMK